MTHLTTNIRRWKTDNMIWQFTKGILKMFGLVPGLGIKYLSRPKSKCFSKS